MSLIPERLRQEFRARFPESPRIFRAPGRVNLIGEHTDYNDGFVMPAAIEFATYTAAAARPDRKVRVDTLNRGESFEFNLDDADAQPRKAWSDYVQGTAIALAKAGATLTGANLLIESDVPEGAGLSSSAALEVSTALALLAIAGPPMNPEQVALACQQAENQFVGVRSGIMDQFASCFGRADHAVLIDCRSLAHSALPLPAGVSLVICNTMVKHELSGGEYNKRRADCEEAAHLLHVKALRDISPDEFARKADRLPDRIRARARHVVSENNRVEQAAKALIAHDLSAFGLLMNESHQSLHDDYEVTCEELDVMAEIARQVRGVYGARMTGGGFGGCTINLVDNDAVPEFRSSVARQYKERTGIDPQIYVTRATAGAAEVGAVS